MANTSLSDLGGKVNVDDPNPSTIPAIGDGTCKAGDLVGKTSGGVVQYCTGSGNLDEFLGILMARYDTDIDTAIASGDACEILVPKGGRRYRCKIEDPSGTVLAGEPCLINADGNGELEKAGDIEGIHCCTLSKTAVTGDTYVEILWGL